MHYPSSLEQNPDCDYKTKRVLSSRGIVRLGWPWIATPIAIASRALVGFNPA